MMVQLVTPRMALYARRGPRCGSAQSRLQPAVAALVLCQWITLRTGRKLEQAIQAFDWQRMLWGDEPPLFLLEIVFRTTVIYGYTMALMRWLGSRTIGQLSSIEFLLVIALGSAVGDAMFYPDVPLLHAMAVITVVVIANKGLDLLVARSRRAEVVVDGKPEEAIRDGVIAASFLDSMAMTTGELFQQLREAGVENLGQVRRAYVETDGTLSIFKTGDGGGGLPIVPPWEISEPETVEAGKSLEHSRHLACQKCGQLRRPGPGLPPGACTNCHHRTWIILDRD